MKLFLAGTSSLSNHGDFLENIAKENELYILESFYYMTPFIEKLIPNFADFLLDSGAFTFMFNKRATLDLKKYLQNYIDFINKNKIQKFFELDIDKLIGYQKVLEIRKILEEETNTKSIPVFHKERGLKEWEKMCEEYDYVAIGTITDYFKNFAILHKLVSIANRYNTKVHGLGFTQLTRLKDFKFYSVDSTTWNCGNRYGLIYQFNGTSITVHQKRKGKRLISRLACKNNFCEWVKYQKYMNSIK